VNPVSCIWHFVCRFLYHASSLAPKERWLVAGLYQEVCQHRNIQFKNRQTFAIIGLGNRADVASNTRITCKYCKTQQLGDISQDLRAVAKNCEVKVVWYITTSSQIATVSVHFRSGFRKFRILRLNLFGFQNLKFIAKALPCRVKRVPSLSDLRAGVERMMDDFVGGVSVYH
jgi:hypothetical protein